MARNQVLRLLIAGITLAATSLAQASWILSPEFSQTAVTPANFQNSTILSVDTSSAGETFASNGSAIISVPFDGSANTSRGLGFTSSHVAVKSIRYDPNDSLNLLVINYRGPGSIFRSNNGTFSQHLAFDGNQSFPRSFAFDATGNLVVGGTYGSATNPGWIRRYDSAGTLLDAFDTPESPVALAFDSAGQAYMANLHGEIFSVLNGGLSPVAKLGPAWVGRGVGYLESFAIDDADGFFLGVTLGQRFGMNSGAILRLSETSEVDVLALGYGDLPVDLSFSPNQDLVVASFNPYVGSKVFRFSGDFAGDIKGVSAVPEADMGAMMLAGLALVGAAARRHRG